MGVAQKGFDEGPEVIERSKRPSLRTSRFPSKKNLLFWYHINLF